MRTLALLTLVVALPLGVQASGPEVLVLKATAYTSSVRETDSTPFVTATGARTRFGIIAVSRDLLGSDLPYGSKVKIEDLGEWRTGRGKGRFDAMLKDVVFVVEDTMHKRKRQQIDVWMPDRSLALKWGVRRVRITVLQRGR
ncbi:3D domain-containing protein [Deinococcota bacterium DY0809b]